MNWRASRRLDIGVSRLLHVRLSHNHARLLLHHARLLLHHTRLLHHLGGSPRVHLLLELRLWIVDHAWGWFNLAVGRALVVVIFRLFLPAFTSVLEVLELDANNFRDEETWKEQGFYPRVL